MKLISPKGNLQTSNLSKYVNSDGQGRTQIFLEGGASSPKSQNFQTLL
jgi:hypothetical protein